MVLLMSIWKSVCRKSTFVLVFAVCTVLLMCDNRDLRVPPNMLSNAKLSPGIGTTNYTESLPSLQVLVSYVYFETDLQPSCERRNKRFNLAMFLIFGVAESSKNVRFHFTFPGNRPNASSIIQSVGVEHSARETSIISRILNDKEPNVVLGTSRVSHPASDLCHHYHVLHNASILTDLRYFFVINDGVRGPFLDAHVANVRQKSAITDPFLSPFLIIVTDYFFS